MRIVNLGSGSKGNSTFICAGQARVLIDVGFSVQEIARRLEKIGEKPEDIDAVIVTHEHVDHIRGFITFLKKYKARGYVPEEIYEEVLEKSPEEVKNKVGKVTDNHFWIDEILFVPLDLPHDSKVCKGYCLEYSHKKVTFMTDLGYFPLNLLQTINGSSLIYIESNHDKKMLRECHYPSIVKARIGGESGHLSNEQAAQVILELAKSGTKYFVLSHISENSNTIEKAYLTCAKAVEDAGYVLEKDIFIRYSRQDRPGNNFRFGE